MQGPAYMHKSFLKAFMSSLQLCYCSRPQGFCLSISKYIFNFFFLSIVSEPNIPVKTSRPDDECAHREKQ